MSKSIKELNLEQLGLVQGGAGNGGGASGAAKPNVQKPKSLGPQQPPAIYEGGPINGWTSPDGGREWYPWALV